MSNEITKTLNGYPYPQRVEVVNPDGSTISGGGGGTTYTEDAASAADPVGGILIIRRRDTLTGAEVSADGDNIAANATAKGELYVKQTDAVPITDNGGNVSVDDGGGSLTVDGTVAATQSGTWNVGTVTTVTNVVHVDDNASTLSIDDGAGSITVDGTVAVSGTVTVDSEFAAAVAAADNLANPTVPQVISHPELYDPTANTWERQRGNSEITLLASQARTADTNSTDQTNWNWRGGHIVINVTALTTSVIPTIKAKDPTSGTYYTLLTGASISATGITILKVYPGIVPVANAAASDVLPRTWRLEMDHIDATTMTYSAAFVGVV